MLLGRMWRWVSGAAVIGLTAPLLVFPALAQDVPAQLELAPDAPSALSLGQVVDSATGLTAPALRTLDEERLFRDSAFGQRVRAELGQASQLLEDENQRLFNELSRDEDALTAARADMRPDEFRAAANAFDMRAESVRRAQAAKRQRLSQYEESEQRRFFTLAGPTLGNVLSSSGAQVLIDARAVLLAAPGVDLTDDGIAALDAEIGDGGPPPFPLVSDGTLRVAPLPADASAPRNNGLDLFSADP